MNVLNKTIRVITVAPVMAALLLLALYFAFPGFGITPLQLVFALFFLSFLPLLAYPVQALIPRLRAGGRALQRRMAIIFSVAGYICGILYSLLFDQPREIIVVLTVTYLTYLVSGIGIALFSALSSVKASGHACGIAGPAAAAWYFIGPIGLIGLALYIPAFIASVRMKRHTVWEFLLGGLVSVAAFFASLLICGS